MTGYLVLARCPGDDIPCALFGDQAEAEDYASELTLAHVQVIAGESLTLDVSELICVTVLAMDGDTLPEVVYLSDEDAPEAIPLKMIEQEPIDE